MEDEKPIGDAGRRNSALSIRLANIRDGEEDYEYLVLAEAALGREKVAALVRKCVSSPTKFSRNATDLAELREWLAETVEASFGY